MNTPPRFFRAPLALALAALLTSAGCGSDDDGDPGDDDPVAIDAAPAGEDDLLRRVTGIVRDVLDVADGIASTPVPMPDVVVETTPSLIYYLSTIDGDSVVVVPRWEDLREERALFDAWAGMTGGAYDGRALFEELFNWFFVAHETGHLLQTVLAQGSEMRWDQELQANEIAVAHFVVTEPARLETFVGALTAVRDSLEVPEGAEDQGALRARVRGDRRGARGLRLVPVRLRARRVGARRRAGSRDDRARRPGALSRHARPSAQHEDSVPGLRAGSSGRTLSA